LDIHEYQAKLILKEFNIPVPDFAVIKSIHELQDALASIGLSDSAVLKVQVHAGGRGKAGGVKLARSKSELETHAKNLLGLKIVNNQTGPQGIVAETIMVSALVDVAKEYYLAITIDRHKGQAILIASPDGGMDIEEVAEKNPERVLTFPILNDGGIRSYHLLDLIKFMGWKGDTAKQGKAIALALAKAFVNSDGSLLEINPLVEDKKGNLIALDAKLSVDDNAIFRQSRIATFYDPSQLPKAEAEAKNFDLAYIALEGNIGCMVNGAGLAMATMDIIKHYGGRPANFLDVGGGATKEKVAEGFKIILADKNVKAILVNIFGGIMNCETLAAGIISAASEEHITVPLIVRMEGTNVQEGKEMLRKSNLKIIIASDLADGAKKAVEATNAEV
jgi:succinyl-CoA synthetase beta subunit